MLPNYKDFPIPKDQIEVLASFVPDLVLKSYSENLTDSEDINPFLAVLLCADISGFTALSETLATMGDKGAFKLTSVINGILGNMVSAIYNNGGDVWKFSGDAFLAAWKVGIKDNYGGVIHRAVHCALQIQQKYGRFETEYNTILRVKIGMSAGSVAWSMVGYDLSKRVILVGAPIKEQMEVLKICNSGEVIITASIWSQINPLYCVYEELCEGKFIKISRMIGYMGLMSTNDINLLSRDWYPNLESKQIGGSSQFLGRLLDYEHGQFLNANILLSTLPPVIQQIQAGLNLEYLTELRALTVVFVNLLPRKMLTTELISMVNQAYIIIHTLATKAGGILDNVSLFDKDIMFILIFGKTCLVHELGTTASLFCGYNIREACIALKGVKSVSVGIATGVCYCGVVGHPQRQEWTIIGSTVNKAARLMTEYVGQVTCDSATQRDAQLPAEYLAQIEYRPLKGFSSKETFYRFSADKRINFKKSLKDGFLPLLHRDDEMADFRQSLNGIKSEHGLLIVGEPKIGKSRLLNEMIVEAADRGLQPEVFGLRIGHSLLSYSAAVHILCHVFCVNKEHAEVSLKRFLRTLLLNRVSQTEFAHLDDLFNPCLTHNPPTEALKRLFVLSFEIGVQSTVIVIDDVHFCDGPSWELLQALTESKVKFLIFTQDSRHRRMEHLKVLTLSPINGHCMPALVCQFMKVQAVQTEVIEYLTTMGLGNPGVCQKQLEAFIANDCTQIIEINSDQKNEHNLMYPEVELLESVAVHAPSFKQLPVMTEHFYNDWPDEDEFNYKDHLAILTAVGDNLLKRRCTINAEKRLNTRRNTCVESLLLVKNIWNYNINSITDDFNLIDPQTSGNVFRIGPYDLSTSDIMIEECVQIFEKRSKDSQIPQSSLHLNDLDYLLAEPPHQTRKKYSYSNVNRSRNLSAKQPSNTLNQSKTLALIQVPETDLMDCAQPHFYVSFLAVFDSLRPFEQLLLKCASVIGSTLERAMLDDVLRNPNDFLISKTIARLFDMDILRCSLREMNSKGEACVCQRSCTFPIEHFSIPQYGFCAHPRFCERQHQEIVYELIPPNVRDKLHERCVDHLTLKPRRCSSCISELNFGSYLAFTTKHLNNNKNDDFLSSAEKLDLFLETTADMPLPNFKKCTCSNVDCANCLQIIHHCSKIGFKEMAFKFKVKYAGLKVSIEELDEAMRIIDEIVMDVKSVSLPNKEKKAFIMELNYLQGKLSFKTGNLDQALDYILKGFQISSLKSNFFAPSGIRRFLVNRILNFKTSKNCYKTAIQLLRLMSEIYALRGNWEEAQFVNKTAMKMLIKFQSPVDLCKCLINLVNISFSQNGANVNCLMDDRIVSAAFTLLPLNNIAGAVIFARIVYHLYLIRSMGIGDLNTGSNLLAVVLKVSDNTELPMDEEHLLLEKIHILVIKGDLSKAHSAIIQLGLCNQLLYHALCLDFLRHTGFWLERPQDSRAYLEAIVMNRESDNDGFAHHRATLSLNLWMFWTNSPDCTALFVLALPENPKPVRSVTDCVTRLMELEVLILMEYFKLDIVPKRPSLRTWTSNLAIMAENFQILQPPFLILQAYKNYRLRRNFSSVRDLLSKADDAAKKQRNELYIQRIAVSRQDWSFESDAKIPNSQTECVGVAFNEWPDSNIREEFLMKFP